MWLVTFGNTRGPVMSWKHILIRLLAVIPTLCSCARPVFSQSCHCRCGGQRPESSTADQLPGGTGFVRDPFSGQAVPYDQQVRWDRAADRSFTVTHLQRGPAVGSGSQSSRPGAGDPAGETTRVAESDRSSRRTGPSTGAAVGGGSGGGGLSSGPGAGISGGSGTGLSRSSPEVNRRSNQSGSPGGGSGGVSTIDESRSARPAVIDDSSSRPVDPTPVHPTPVPPILPDPQDDDDGDLAEIPQPDCPLPPVLPGIPDGGTPVPPGGPTPGNPGESPVVPEPGSLALLGIGGLLGAGHWWRKRKQSPQAGV